MFVVRSTVLEPVEPAVQVQPAHGEILHLLPEPQFSFRSLGASAAIHIAAAIVLLLVPLFFTDAIRPVTHDLWVQMLDPNPVMPRTEAPPPKRVTLHAPPPAALKTLIPPSPPKIAAPAVQIEAPRPVAPEIKMPEVAVIAPPRIPEPPQPQVRTGVFSTPPAAAPAARPLAQVQVGALETPRAAADNRPRGQVQVGALDGPQQVAAVNRPRGEVQTGGFGDPNGTRAENIPGKPVNAARLGSFDAPAGPGLGNGTGGAAGVPGRVVASSGFGSAAPAGAAPPSPQRSVVASGGFGDARPAAAPQPQRVRLAETAPTEPVEIVSKPRPVYTDEARRLKIEGEVLVEARFSAAGEIKVLRVVRPLGHGLDEAALRAAEQIRFKPARRNGQPVDQTAIIHIVFQLAY